MTPKKTPSRMAKAPKASKKVAADVHPLERLRQSFKSADRALMDCVRKFNTVIDELAHAKAGANDDLAEYERVKAELDAFKRANLFRETLDRVKDMDLINERDALAKELADYKEQLEWSLKNERKYQDALDERLKELNEANKKLADLKAKHEELLSYMPKVPTEPYEKLVAKSFVELQRELAACKAELAATKKALK
jgi:chorismate mutase